MQKSLKKYFDADTVTKLAHIGYKPSGLVEGSMVGNHKSPFHGFAIEFAGHRGYVPGDDIKHIDWTAYYKTNKYLIKQYEQETNFVAHLVIDISQSMTFEHEHGMKMEYAAYIATAIAQVIIAQSDSVGVHFFDNEIKKDIAPSNTQEIVDKISDYVSTVEMKSPTAINKVLSMLAEQIGRRHVLFIISDFFGDLDETFMGIKRLMDDKHEIVLLQIVDPIEMNFDIPGKVKFIELEGDDTMEAKGISIKDSYEEAFNGFIKEVRERSLGLGIDTILCDMSKPFGFHLAEYMSGRLFR